MKPKSNENQPAKDLCWTPPYATEALCQFLAEQSGVDVFSHRAWDPACGAEYMKLVLDRYFRDVFASDINPSRELSALFNGNHTRWLPSQMDFLDDRTHKVMDDRYDCIITNPPYTAKTKYAFIERCIDLGKPFALLMPIETMSADKAQQLFARIGGVSVLHFDTRVDFKQAGKTWVESQAQFPTAWFIHGFGLEPNRNYYTSIKAAKKAFREEMKAVAE